MLLLLQGLIFIPLILSLLLIIECSFVIVEERDEAVHETMTLTQMDATTTNNNNNNDILNQISQVKSMMLSNIDTVLQRGEMIELLSEKSRDLSSSSMQFKKSSTSLKRRLFWRNVKLWVYFLAAHSFISLLYFLFPSLICRRLSLYWFLLLLPSLLALLYTSLVDCKLFKKNKNNNILSLLRSHILLTTLNNGLYKVGSKKMQITKESPTKNRRNFSELNL